MVVYVCSRVPKHFHAIAYVYLLHTHTHTRINTYIYIIIYIYIHFISHIMSHMTCGIARGLPKKRCPSNKHQSDGLVFKIFQVGTIPGRIGASPHLAQILGHRIGNGIDSIGVHHASGMDWIARSHPDATRRSWNNWTQWLFQAIYSRFSLSIAPKS